MKTKPCPFCGSNNPTVVLEGNVGKYRNYSIVCADCVASVAWYKTMTLAKKAWNRRK
jgi:Lar family restriction alleviation protein